MVTLTETSLPATSLTVGLPSTWTATDGPDGGLLAVEDVAGRFAASVSALVVRDAPEIPADAVAATMAPLVAPQLLHLRADEGMVEFLLCHLVAEYSVTALQRQVLTDEGLVVLTVTTATSRWSELADLAVEVLDSLEVTS